jgi:putative transcriptional regulator
MRSGDMATVEHNPGDPPIEVEAVDAQALGMTEEELEAAILADTETDSPPIPLGTDEELARIGLIHIPNPVKLRRKLGMTQEEFATAYRIPVGTLRDWEQGRKFPDSTARAYLIVIAADPERVAKLLRPAA